MAGRPSTVANHPKKQQITADLLAGDSIRNVAKRYNLNSGAIARHRLSVVKPTIRLLDARPHVSVVSETVAEKVAEKPPKPEVAEAVALAQSTAEMAEAKYQRYRRMLQLAESKEDLRAWAMIDSAETKGLFLRAQLRGELQNNNTVNINIAIAGMELPGMQSVDGSGSNAAIDMSAEPA